MKQARIKCPHCGEQITVRQTDANAIAPENVARIWAMTTEMNRIFDNYFRKIFDPKLWK